MIQRALKTLSCPFAVMASVALISFLALLVAISSEAFLGLEPCVLCIYQRWPYAIVMAIGALTLALRKKIGLMIGLAFSALAFIINSGIAFYHTGVEQKWWASKVEGCAVPDFTALSSQPQSILENILSAPTANCAEIPWQDPLLGLSMANYNIVMCLSLAVICGASLWISRKSRHCHKT